MREYPNVLNWGEWHYLGEVDSLVNSPNTLPSSTPEIASRGGYTGAVVLLLIGIMFEEDG